MYSGCAGPTIKEAELQGGGWLSLYTETCSMAVLLNTGTNMKVSGLENAVLKDEHMMLRGHCIPGCQKRGQVRVLQEHVRSDPQNHNTKPEAMLREALAAAQR